MLCVFLCPKRLTITIKMSGLLQILLSFVKIAERVCLAVFLVVMVVGFFVARYFLRLVGSMTKIFVP